MAKTVEKATTVVEKAEPNTEVTVVEIVTTAVEKATTEVEKAEPTTEAATVAPPVAPSKAATKAPIEATTAVEKAEPTTKAATPVAPTEAPTPPPTVNPCKPDPCQNGGTCSGNGKCQCTDLFKGDKCEYGKTISLL